MREGKALSWQECCNLQGGRRTHEHTVVSSTHLHFNPLSKKGTLIPILNTTKQSSPNVDG